MQAARAIACSVGNNNVHHCAGVWIQNCGLRIATRGIFLLAFWGSLRPCLHAYRMKPTCFTDELFVSPFLFPKLDPSLLSIFLIFHHLHYFIILCRVIQLNSCTLALAWHRGPHVYMQLQNGLLHCHCCSSNKKRSFKKKREYARISENSPLFGTSPNPFLTHLTML